MENGFKTVVVVVGEKEKEVFASYFGPDGKVHKGKARCAAGDEFRPEIGAVIALCRAMGAEPALTCFDVMDAYAKQSARDVEKAAAAEAAAKSSVKVKTSKPQPHEVKGTPVGKLKEVLASYFGPDGKGGRGILKPVGGFAAMDPSEARSYGVMGTPTKFFDKDGKMLSVGDLVTVDVLQGDVRTGRKWVPVPDLAFVVDEDSDDPVSKGQYIMGAMSACNPKTGKIDGKFRIRKVKSWKEVEVGEVHQDLRVTWEVKLA